MSRLIDADALLKKLGMAFDCKDCPNKAGPNGIFCGLGSEMMEVCETISDMIEKSETEGVTIVVKATEEVAELLRRIADKEEARKKLRWITDIQDGRTQRDGRDG